MNFITTYRRLCLNNCTLLSRKLKTSCMPVCSSLYDSGSGYLYSTEIDDEKTNSQMNAEIERTPYTDDETLDRLDLAYDEKDDKHIIKIDVEKWKDVPASLDISHMKNYPLFNSKCKPIKNKEIQKISIFEEGYKRIPSVRNVLKETMSELDKEILVKWEIRMVREMGEDKFDIYRKRLLSRGDILHQCIELYFRGEGPHPEHLVGVEELWNSVIHSLNAISNVQMLESRIIHPDLCYQGVVDCVGMYKNKMVAIEFKTSTKPKLILSATRDDPLQVAAYLGALNFDENYNFPYLDGSLLVIAYPSGLPAHAHYLDRNKSEAYWKLWQKRLLHFWKMQHTE